MEPITYHVTRSRLYSATSYMLIASILLVAAPVGLFVLLYLTGDEVDLGSFAVFALILVLVIPATVRVLRHSSQAENSLRLDDHGLTRLSWGRTYRWDWRELSGFEVRGVAKFGFLTPDRYIPIVKPGDGAHLRSRLARRGLGGVLRDEYDAPLEDIAATLNEYRERALAGGSRAPGPT